MYIYYLYNYFCQDARYSRRAVTRFQSPREWRRIVGQIFAVSSLPRTCTDVSGLIKPTGVSGKSWGDERKESAVRLGEKEMERERKRKRRRKKEGESRWTNMVCVGLLCHSKGGCSCGRSVRAQDSSFHLRVAGRDVSVCRIARRSAVESMEEGFYSTCDWRAARHMPKYPSFLTLYVWE